VSGYAVTRIDEIPKRDSWIPVRDHFGIGAFGVNAYHAEEAGGSVIGDHTELMSKHEELYVVLEGHATFTVDGEEVDAPAGTLVYVSDPAARRRAVAKEAGTTVLVAGAQPGEPFRISPWEESWKENREAMALYREQRYAEAAAVLRDALDRYPDSAGIEYNLACFESMAGSAAETVARHLAHAIALYPGFRDFAREDSDFAPVKDDPAIQALMEEAS
jgi:quercetin dioxygenase-like cupin family protein